MILCPSGYCHTLRSQVINRGKLSVSRACYEQNHEPQRHQQPREYILYFVFVFVLNCRQVLGWAEQESKPVLYSVLHGAEDHGGIHIHIDIGHRARYYCIQCLCDYSLCNRTNGEAPLGQENYILILAFMMIRLSLKAQ